MDSTIRMVIALAFIGAGHFSSTGAEDFQPGPLVSLIAVETGRLETDSGVFEDLRDQGCLTLAARWESSAFLYVRSPALEVLRAGAIEHEVLIGQVDERELYTVPKTSGVLRASLERYGPVIYEDDSSYLVAVSPRDAAGVHMLRAKKRLPGVSAPGLPLRLPTGGMEQRPRPSFVYTPGIQAMVDSVSPARLYSLISDLTGENPVTIAGKTYSINTRLSQTTMCRWAGQFIRERFETMGIDADFDYFNFRTLMKDVVFVDHLTGWAVGKQMTIVGTQDGGQLWTEQHWGDEGALNDIFMLTQARGCAVGNNGVIMSTYDGQTWQRVPAGTVSNLNAVFFTDSLTAFACGQAGTILRSDDGGATWAPVESGTGQDLHGIYFTGPDVGWSVGNGGLILKTEDGGAGWATVPSPVGEDLRDVVFQGESRGWACGLSGTIVSTEDGGTWQEAATPDSGDLYSLSFAGEQVGWACGPAGTVIKTTDGGAVWNDLSLGPSRDLRDVFFVDTGEGWIAGDGIIYHSSSGGAAWEDQGDAVNTGPVNVVATIPGASRPEDIYIICAHYDCTSEDPYAYAPGADDNATGTASAIEAARALKDCVFEATLRFVCFSWEEQGLVGSAAYVAEAYERGDNIIGALNFDMIGYSRSSPEDINIRYNDFSGWLADDYEAAAGLYVPDLPVYKSYTTGGGGSDHSSFWDYGYPAFLGIEGPAFGNPYYHTTGDRISTLDFDFFTKVVKGGVATLAELAVIDTSMSSIVRRVDPRAPGVSPNPARGRVAIEMTGTGSGPAAFEIYDVNGRLVSIIEPSAGDGVVRAVWGGRDASGGRVSPGIYFVKVSGHSVGSKIVLLR